MSPPERPYPADDWRRRLIDLPDDREAWRAWVGQQYMRQRSGAIGPWVDRALAAVTHTLDPLWIETVAGERGFSPGINTTACALLGYPTQRPANLILVNTLPRVPTLPLEAALIRLLRLQRGSMHVHGEFRTTAFDPVQARRELHEGRLVRSHVPASLRLRACMNLLRIRPVLMVRNIFDALASYVGDNYFIALGHRFDKLDRDQQRRVLMLRNASEIVDFYASWSVIAKLNPRMLRIDLYEDVRGDWVGYTQRILRERGANVGREVIERAMQDIPADPLTPPNDFTDAEKALVRELYAQYPTVDFSRIDPEYDG